MDINKTKKDSKAIASGQWVKDLPGMGDLAVKVRGWESVAVAEARARLSRAAPQSDRSEDGGLTLGAQMRIDAEVLAQVAIINWAGLTDGGEEVEFSRDLAVAWITDPDYGDFANAVFSASQRVQQGKGISDEVFLGN